MISRTRMRNKLLLLIVLALTLGLCACNNSGMSDEELAQTAAELIEASHEINVIFYGEGLPVDKSTSVIEDEDAAEVGNYCRVTEDSPYQSIDEIKAAAEKVFTSEYLSEIYESAFEGNDILRPRYGTDSTGHLTRDITIGTLKQTDEWTGWDLSSIKIKKASAGAVVFSITGTYSGKTEDEVMQMIKTSDGWRLDSPTY